MTRTPAISRFRGEFRFLSNFWPVGVTFEGRTFPSVEHAYQAAKSLDDGVRARIAGLATAREAKAAGQEVELRRDWDDVRVDVMRELVAAKFDRFELARRLLATGDADLIEGNTWGDTFWGVCDGAGENHLGRILMEVRGALRAAERSR